MVLLPQSVERYTPDEINCIFVFEIVHLRPYQTATFLFRSKFGEICRLREVNQQTVWRRKMDLTTGNQDNFDKFSGSYFAYRKSTHDTQLTRYFQHVILMYIITEPNQFNREINTWWHSYTVWRHISASTLATFSKFLVVNDTCCIFSQIPMKCVFKVHLTIRKFCLG